METKERQQELKKLLVTTYFQVYTEKEMTLKKTLDNLTNQLKKMSKL
ncbi:hypothetical protein P9386_06415 [Caldifermentibacillus hisashii]|nr:hypothetical protein [Caldifermentibacillus hisashii]